MSTESEAVTSVLRASRVWRAEGDAAQADPARTLFLASDDSLDRYATRIQQDWLEDGRMAAFDANPVIMFMHDYREMPVGTAVMREIRSMPDGRQALFIEVEWDMEDPEAAGIAGKYARGVMRAGSVGFASHRQQSLADMEDGHPWKADRGELLSRNELREFSAVPIPGNANALVQGRFGPSAWLASGILETAPADIAAEVRRLLMEDDSVRRVIAEAAGDLHRSTVEHAAAEAIRASHPMSWIYRS